MCQPRSVSSKSTRCCEGSTNEFSGEGLFAVMLAAQNRFFTSLWWKMEDYTRGIGWLNGASLTTLSVFCVIAMRIEHVFSAVDDVNILLGGEIGFGSKQGCH